MFEVEKLAKKNVKKNIEEGNIEQARIDLGEYEKINPKDMEVHCMKSIIEFLSGNYNRAEEILTNIYNKYEFNFDINYNLGVINVYQNDYKVAIKYLIKALFIDSSKSDIVQEMIYNIPEECLSEEDLEIEKEKMLAYFSNYKKVFPRINKTESYIGKKIEVGEKSYYCGMYDYYFPERDGILFEYENSAMNLLKTETLQGKEERSLEFKVKNKAILPIMKLSLEDIILSINKKEFNLNKNLPNRFYYYPLEENDVVTIKSEDKFVVGDLISKKIDSNKPKLILNIFIDGLSQKFLKDNDIKECMPNTYSFFKEGTICSNTYVSGEWTYVSMASFFTGKYTKNHRVFHPKYDCENLFKEELYTEILNKNGYFCSKIDGDWRSTPSYGYVKGLDRFLYQSSIRGMHCDDVIIESIEHLEAFKEKNNFLWICIPDLHDIADELETRISTQVRNHVSDRNFMMRHETSVRKGYNEGKINRYRVQAKRIDTYLGMLYNYLKENYKDNEFVVSLFADHGQGYLVDSDNFLDDGRTNTAMMFRGRNIPKGQCDELIQGLDLFPIIFKSIGLSDVDIKDGKIPMYFDGECNREYTITESVFPESPYRVAINDLEHKFFFETVELCTDDGRVKMQSFESKLINKKTDKDETSIYKDKVEKYTNVCIEHIKEFIIIED